MGWCFKYKGVQDSSPIHQPTHYLLIGYVQPTCIIVSQIQQYFDFYANCYWDETPINGNSWLYPSLSMRDNDAVRLYIPDEQVVSGLMSGWWVLDSFVFKTSAHSLATHWVCATHLHHCLSLTKWDVVKNFHLWVFHPNSSWHKSQSTVGFERQWCRWVVHTLWACSEWADQWVMNFGLFCI